MSYTMILADDEPIVLKSEELFIKKEFPEIELVGMAENGIQLKNMMEKFKPDMAIIDIQMPGLNGIEVMELLKNKGFRTHFVISTAYSDFEYVKSALDLKADGYILKPSKKSERIEVINKLIQAVEKEKQEDLKQRNYSSAINVVNSVLGSEILLGILAGQESGQSFEDYCKLNNISFHKGCIATFLPERTKEISRSNLFEELQKVINGNCDFLASYAQQGIVVMIILPKEIHEREEKQWTESLTEMIAAHFEQVSEQYYRYGTGGVYDSFSEMKQSYKESIQHFEVGKFVKTDETDIEKDKLSAYIEKTKRYVDNYYHKDISLIDCAESVGISSYYLSHIFKERTGQNFVEYLSGIRIQKAKELSKNTLLTINEISERCGYRNVSYFCKVFKRVTGMTIGEYKKESERME